MNDTFRQSVESFVSERGDIESDSELGTVVDLSNLNVDWRRTSFQSLNSSNQPKLRVRERETTNLFESSSVDSILLG